MCLVCMRITSTFSKSIAKVSFLVVNYFHTLVIVASDIRLDIKTHSLQYIENYYWTPGTAC